MTIFKISRGQKILSHLLKLPSSREYRDNKVNDSRVLNILSKMSRPLEKHISEAQKQRKLVKERSSKYVPGTVTLQVLGSGSSGAPNSVYIFTDQSRYLFNCGEGTQRLAYEHKMKLARLERIFLTSADWRSMGGLPGLSLTLQDVGVPQITLHGPPGLGDLFTATRKFVVLKDMKIESPICNEETQYEDCVMTVKYVPIERIDKNPSESHDKSVDNVNIYRGEGNVTNTIEADNTDYYAHETSGRRNIDDGMFELLLAAPKKEIFSSMAYICRLKSLPGTLDLQKCVDKGVKPGPILGVLKNGQDVTLEDGKIIFSKDVRTPDEPGAIFIVIDLPDVNYLDSLKNSTRLKKHQEHPNINPDDKPALIIHFTPKEVMRDERYQDFMNSFSPNTYHLLVNNGNDCSGSVAIHRAQHKLQLLNDKIFPLIQDFSIPIEDKNTPLNLTSNSDPIIAKVIVDKVALLESQLKINSQKDILVDVEQSNSNDFIIPAKTFTTFHLRPKKGLDRSAELRLNVTEYITEAMNSEGLHASLERLHTTVNSIHDKNEEKKYPYIVFLGTGSCIPNKTRNTSGIMLHTDENNCVLLDCGEGTFGQMYRFYGKDEIANVLLKIKAIYLSHLHADHHLGLIGVLQERTKALMAINGSHSGANNMDTSDDHNLYILAPEQIMSWLSLYDKRFERILHQFILIPNLSLVKSSSTCIELPKSLLNHIGLSAVETCLVRHCPNAFGISLTTKDSKKITYSGDTMPCATLVDIGLDSDLLIHEATMEDDLEGEARRKMHSTAGQAVSIGRSMGARFTMLTHFSQRYARVPRLAPAIENSTNCNVGIAFDNMKISLNDLYILPHFYAPLKLLFAEHCEDLENKAVKRALKRERAASPPNKLPGTSRGLHTEAKHANPLNPNNDENQDVVMAAKNKLSNNIESLKVNER